MASIKDILNHAALAVGRLATQFRDSPRLKGMVTVISNEAQAIETAFGQLKAQMRDYTVANDNALDNIGSLVGAPVRGTRNNTSYRLRVIGQIAANRSSGESASIYLIAKSLVVAWNVSGQPKIREHKPAHFTVGCDPAAPIVNDEAQARELANVLNDSSSAGVRCIVESRSAAVGNGNFFRFAGGAGPAKGFGVGKLKGAYDR